MIYVNCKKYAQDILDAVKAMPHKKKLVILTAGNDPASESYVKGKIKDCQYCGIPYEHIRVSSKSYLGLCICQRAADPNVGGIIVQLPLPEGWDEKYFTNLVPPHLDVDGFTTRSPFKPCTPEGIMYILRKELGDLTGKDALVIGRGKLVGKPIAQMLLDADCTVTIAHSKTPSLNHHLCTADIVISAVGKSNLVDLKHCQYAQIVVDVGVNRTKDGKLCGDCYNFDEFDPVIECEVTPVPGGIGLLTRAMLMAHVCGLEVGSV